MSIIIMKYCEYFVCLLLYSDYASRLAISDFYDHERSKIVTSHKQEVFIFSAREDNYENTEVQIYLACAYFLFFPPAYTYP